ncbi:MAG: YfiR family protein [Bdellovibrionales bacterium]|nr:YfiR family protein [Bdellovibrionales bacterium]
MTALLALRSILARTCCIILTFVWSELLLASSAAAERPSLEYQVKASLLFNFLSYIEWPADAFTDDSVDLFLCVVGSDPFGVALEAVDGELVRGRRLTVLRLAAMESPESARCNAVFFSASASENVAHTLPYLRRRPVLTVSDQLGFLAQGGMIEFLITDKKVRFRVRPEAAKRARLALSSHLLRLAESVITD